MKNLVRFSDQSSMSFWKLQNERFSPVAQQQTIQNGPRPWMDTYPTKAHKQLRSTGEMVNTVSYKGNANKTE